MRIHKLLLSLLLMVALLPLAGGALGLYQSFKEKEAKRAEELAENMLSNLVSRVEDIVEKIDMVMQWAGNDSEESLSDDMLFHTLRHLHIQDIMRLEDDSYLSRLSERVIVKHRFSVDGRSYGVELISRDGELLPVMRVTFNASRVGDVIAIYFSPRAIMDYHIADGATVVAYNEQKKISGVVYPLTLHSTTSTPTLLQSQLVQELLENQGVIPNAFDLEGYYFVTNGRGLLVGRKMSPWSAFNWIPTATWWWVVMLLGVTLSLIFSYAFVCRYVARPVKVISVLAEDSMLTPTKLKGFSKSVLIPKELQTLMNQVRHSISHNKNDRKILASETMIVSDGYFIKQVQHAIVKSMASGGGLILLVIRPVEGSDYPLSLTHQRERIERVIDAANDFCNMQKNNQELINHFIGEQDSSALWVWVETRTSLDTVSCNLLRYLECRFRDSLFMYSYPELHFADKKDFSVAEDIVESLLYSSRDERWSLSGKKLIAVDNKRIVQCYYDKLLNNLAKKGFQSENVQLKITPIVKNGTGEVCFFRLSPHAIVGNDSFEIRPGEWILRDHRGSYLNELVIQIIQMAKLLDQSGFNLIRLALPFSLRHLEHPKILAKLTDIAPNLSKRIILEVSAEPLKSRHYQLLSDLADSGVGIAVNLKPGYYGALGIPKVYTFIQASLYNSMGQLYHKTLLEKRKLGGLVIDLDDASDMLRTSAFYHSDDYSKIIHENNLSLHDAIKFLQQDISLNVLRTNEVEAAEEDYSAMPDNVVILKTLMHN